MTILPRPTTVLQIISNSRKPLASFALFTACLLAQPTMAVPSSQAPANQTPANQPPADRMTTIAIPAQPDAIELGTGPLPGATAPESWHSQYGSKFARNVTVATLTPFLPDPSKASGAAVIVAPGGGFRTLSMENEGSNVARALADKGVAAFVLKYRLNQTPADLDEFARPAAPAAPPARPRGGAVRRRALPRRTWPPASRRRSPTPTPPSRSSAPTRRSGTSIPTASA